MTTSLQVANKTITADKIIPLLADYQILSKLSREVLIDQAIESINCTLAEKGQVVEQFYLNIRFLSCILSLT